MKEFWDWMQNNFIASYLLYSLMFFLLSFILYSVFTWFLKRLCKQFKVVEYKQVLRLIRMPILITSLLLAVGSPFLFFATTNRGIEVAKNVVIVLLIFSVAWLLVRSIKVLKLYLFSSLEQNERDKKFKTQFEILEKIIIVIIFFLAFVLSFMNFESIRRIGVSLFASAGVAGIILGLSAQKLIAAVISGLQLALTQPIRINDIVVVESEYGTVEEINLTYVVIKTWDLRRLVLPSTYFLERPFYNWSRVSSELLCTVYIHVDYAVPLESLREEFTRLLKNHQDWDQKESGLQVTNANDKTLELRALFGVDDASKAWGLRVHVREGMIEYIRSHYPSSFPKLRIDQVSP